MGNQKLKEKEQELRELFSSSTLCMPDKLRDELVATALAHWQDGIRDPIVVALSVLRDKIKAAKAKRLMEVGDFVIELPNMNAEERRHSLTNECSREDLVYILEGWEIVAQDEDSAGDLVEMILAILG